MDASGQVRPSPVRSAGLALPRTVRRLRAGSDDQFALGELSNRGRQWFLRLDQHAEALDGAACGRFDVVADRGQRHGGVFRALDIGSKVDSSRQRAACRRFGARTCRKIQSARACASFVVALLHCLSQRYHFRKRVVPRSRRSKQRMALKKCPLRRMGPGDVVAAQRLQKARDGAPHISKGGQAECEFRLLRRRRLPP